jgi:uncharacterized protein
LLIFCRIQRKNSLKIAPLLRGDHIYPVGGKLTRFTKEQSQYILVVAKSARMLAQAAHRAGFKPLAVDLFGDQDTRFYAEETQQIPSLAKEHLLPVIASFVKCYPVTYAVYGSGFEAHLDSLSSIDSQLTLLGNHPDVFAEVQNKPRFFALLEAFQIPFPEVSFRTQASDTEWLRKPMQGEGGIGIRKHRRGDLNQSSAYWQKFQAGEPHSVLFLADGKRSQIIGFNKQWTVSLSDVDEFLFSGVINSTHLSLKQKSKIKGWLDLLVPKLSLKGLNTLDFIQYGPAIYVLEINPRPSASMQLYASDLLSRHIKACEGKLIDCKADQIGFTAYEIIYAQKEIPIPWGFQWPDDVLDIPKAGSIIGAGQPICSIIARGKEPDEVLRQLAIKQELITNQTHRFQSHGI